MCCDVQMVEMKKAAGGQPALVQALQDSLKSEYEDFDDYIEMSIQFGCACAHSWPDWLLLVHM